MSVFILLALLIALTILLEGGTDGDSDKGSPQRYHQIGLHDVLAFFYITQNDVRK